MRISEYVLRQMQTCLPKDQYEDLARAAQAKERDRPVVFVMVSPQLNACDYYRAYMVERELRKYDLFTTRFVHALGPKEAYESDLLIAFRPKDPSLLAYLSDPMGQNAAVMADFDDDVFSVPKANFLAPNFTPPDKQNALQIVQRVGQLTTSTRRLRGLLQSSQPRGTVIPNTIDFQRYSKLLMHPKQPAKRYRVGWAGTFTHAEDIMGGDQVFLRALDEFMKKYRDTEAIFFGFCPDSFMQKHYGRVAHVDPVQLYQYMPRLAGLNLDLVVYPLLNQQFNHSKSNIRWLEASMLHVPIIASNIPSYKEVGEELCCTVPLTFEAWFGALEYAYKNKDEMRSRAEKSREWIREHWSIQAMAPAWAAVMQAAASGSHIVQDFTPPTYGSKPVLVPKPVPTQVKTGPPPRSRPKKKKRANQAHTNKAKVATKEE